MSYEPLTTLIAPALGIGWQSGTDLTVDIQPIGASANIVRNWNGIAKNLVDPEFRLFAIRISSGEGEYRPPALANLWPGEVFTVVPPNEHAVLIPIDGSSAVFPRLVHSARALTLGFEHLDCTVSGKTVTLSAPATEVVRVYARWIHEVIVVEPWTESYQERLAESRWTLATEELGNLMLGLAFIPSYDTPFDPEVHATDDTFFNVSGSIMEERIGSIINSSFRVTLENPGVTGIMNGSTRYAVLWEKREIDSDPVVLARGRMVPLPTGMAGQTLEITFRCLPPTSDDVLKAAADLRRVGEVDYDPDAPAADRDAAEAYDPLFYSTDASDDPEGALAGTTEVWKWDRQTLALSTTDMITSSVLHTIDFEGIKVPPALSISVPPKPITRLRLVASWTQHAKGQQTVAEADEVTTFTYDDFLSSFPKPGQSIGSATGWTLAKAEIVSVEDASTNWVSISGAKFGAASGGLIEIRPKRIRFLLSGAYDYSQQREEPLDISMPAALQEIPDDDDESETVQVIQLAALNIDGSTQEWEYEDPETLERNHFLVGDERLANGKAWTAAKEHDATEDFTVIEPETGDILWTRREKRAPMRNSGSAKWFDTDRGTRSHRHGIRRLRRIVLERSQCAETTFEVPWEIGRIITCADSCHIRHSRLPGGELVGKVGSIELLISVDGVRTAMIKLLSTIGTGEAAAVPGEGQQQTGDVVYSTSFRGVNEPVNVSALSAQSPRVYEFENIWSDQLAAALGEADPIAAIGANPTRLTIAFKALREEDLLRRRMSIICEPIAVPMQINLRPDFGG